MKRLVVCVALALVTGMAPALSGLGACAFAEGMHHAGVVVEGPDGAPRAQCVAFSEDSITGVELLRRSGAPILFQDYGAGAVTVCKIGDVGTDYPRAGCFSRCPNANSCEFWGYFRYDAAATRWEFSDTGAGTTLVHDGDVQAWRWGSHAGGANAPSIAGTAVCSAGASVGMSVPRAPQRRAPGAAIAVFFVVLAILGAYTRRLRRARAAAAAADGTVRA